MTRAIATVLAFFAPLGIYLFVTHIDGVPDFMILVGAVAAALTYDLWES